MKAIGRVRHALSLQHVQVLVDQEEIAGADLVEAKAQALGVPVYDEGWLRALDAPADEI